MDPHPSSLNRFRKLFDLLARTNSRGRVFDDFLTLATCALHPATLYSHCGREPDPTNEKAYLDVAGRYDPEALNRFSEALSCLMGSVHHAPYSDLLGTWFEEHLSNERTGQFFTPMTLCTMMAQMTALDHEEPGRRVCDPCAGSGRLLLAGAEVAPNHFYYGADVDLTCAQMTALNMMLNGLRGEVAWMDSLTLQIWRVWSINAGGIGIEPIAVESSYFQVASAQVVRDYQERKAAAPPPPLPPRREKPIVSPPPMPGQLMLF